MEGVAGRRPRECLAASWCRSGEAEFDPCLVEVVRRHFHFDTIAHADADEILPHFAGDMSEHFVPVGKLDPEHGAWKDLAYRPFEFNRFFFVHATTDEFLLVCAPPAPAAGAAGGKWQRQENCLSLRALASNFWRASGTGVLGYREGRSAL